MNVIMELASNSGGKVEFVGEFSRESNRDLISPMQVNPIKLPKI